MTLEAEFTNDGTFYSVDGRQVTEEEYNAAFDRRFPRPPRQTVLQEAEELINGDRKQEYGHPIVNLGRIATLWSAYLKSTVTADDVAALMILLKVARLKTGHGTRDTWIDIAGYAGLLEMIGEPDADRD